MTASSIIDSMAPILIGTKYGDTTLVANRAILLTYLNMAKNEIAQDTLYWLNGEQILMLDGIFEYELSLNPIQVVDVFDANNVKRPRNSSEYYGYYQISPKVLYFNNVVDALAVKVNYYYAPTDYIEADVIDVPPILLNAMQYFMAHKSLESFRDANNMSGSQMYLQRYEGAINKFVATTDNTNLDTTDEIDRIWQRNLV